MCKRNVAINLRLHYDAGKLLSVTVISDGLFVLNYWAAKYNEEGISLDLKIATFRICEEGLKA